MDKLLFFEFCTQLHELILIELVLTLTNKHQTIQQTDLLVLVDETNNMAAKLHEPIAIQHLALNRLGPQQLPHKGAQVKEALLEVLV